MLAGILQVSELQYNDGATSSVPSVLYDVAESGVSKHQESDHPETSGPGTGHSPDRPGKPSSCGALMVPSAMRCPTKMTTVGWGNPMAAAPHWNGSIPAWTMTSQTLGPSPLKSAAHPGRQIRCGASVILNELCVSGGLQGLQLS